MKKAALTLILALAAMPMFAQVEFYHGSWDELLAKAKKEKKIIMVDFWATWCGPCRIMNARTFKDAEVGKVQNKNFISYKVDGDTQLGSTLGNKYGIRAYPTFLFIDAKGKVVFTSQGYQPVNAWLTTLNEAAQAAGFQLSDAGTIKADPPKMPQPDMLNMKHKEMATQQIEVLNQDEELYAKLEQAHDLGRSNNSFDLDPLKKK